MPTVIIFIKFKFNHGHSLSKVLRWQINSQDQSKLHPPPSVLYIDLSQSDPSHLSGFTPN